jgi:hypothetical protein
MPVGLDHKWLASVSLPGEPQPRMVAVKRLVLALFLSALFSACSIDTVTGPAEGERGIEPTDLMCNRNAQLC